MPGNLSVVPEDPLDFLWRIMVGADLTKSSDSAAVKPSHPSISLINTPRIQAHSAITLKLRTASSFWAVLHLQASSGDENSPLIVIRDELRFRDLWNNQQ